jgi:hypothetical protein
MSDHRFARTLPVSDWFFDWLTYHQSIHCSKFWIAADDTRAVTVYQGWIESFERMRITKEEAKAVTRLLQERKAPYPDRQLEWFRERYIEMKHARKVRENCRHV